MLINRRFFATALCGFIAATTFVRADNLLSWPPITPQTRPWTWWWWHGSAVDQTNIAVQLQKFHKAGLGGVQITTIYGVKGAEARDIPYLSPAWMQMLDFTVDDARSLHMGVTMSLGSGWCFGGPTVSDKDANASAVVKTLDVNGGEQLKAKFNRSSTQALVAFASDGKTVELADKIADDGSVDWIAPAGSWKIYSVSQKPSGQKVKRAAPGGEGWMLNPLYPQAVRNWLPWFQNALTHYTGSKPEAVFQDSYEYRTDWSPDFLAQFERLRGYKLQDELPALFGKEENDHVARVKYDYRRTVSDIMATESEPIWIDWAHKNGFQTIYQAHGTPGNWLDLYADADVPETEMFHNDRSILISKFASSAAHVAGRKLTGAETGTWLKEHFTVTLADLKYLADDMFLSGVNNIFYHGCCYSPESAPWPGWVFYASTELNPRNSIWHDVPALNEYISRAQSILQAGKPDNDILLYWPVADFWTNPRGRIFPMTVSATDWFKNQPIGKTANELWNDGYAFDYVSDAQLLKAKVENGKIEMPGGDYKTIVVPDCKYMPLETFAQLLALAKAGATVIFENQLPTEVAGAKELEKRQPAFAEISAEISKDALESGIGGKVKNIGSGRILFAGGLINQLTHASVHPERLFGLSYIRRSFDGGWNYFVANRGTNNFNGWITLARPVKSAVLLDPMTGNAGVAAQNENGQIHLQLAAGESLILRALADKKVEGSAWNNFEKDGSPIEIIGTWNVKFIEGGPSLPADAHISNLTSWTKFPDPGAEAFGGTARYEITFDAPNSSGTRYFLDLGDVRQSARVQLNGTDFGTLIIPPFRVVVNHLQPTGNKLEIEVTSTDANRIRDLDRRGVQWKIFKDINVVNENYRPFNAANWPLTDCGLLGPVTLTPVKGN